MLYTRNKDDGLILKSYTEIPTREKWLFDNQAALKKVKQGIKDARLGRLIEKDSFRKHIAEDTK